jgi:hypothetical protein
MFIPLSFIAYYLFVPKMHTHTQTYIYILKYIIVSQIAPRCSGASAPSSGSLDIAFAKVMNIKYKSSLPTSTLYAPKQDTELHMQPLPHFINSTDFIINDLLFNEISIILIFYNFRKRNIKAP